MRSFSIILFMLLSLPALRAQIIDPNETAKRKATDRANGRIDQGIDKGLDKIEEGIGSIFKKDKQKKNSGKEAVQNRTPAENIPEKSDRTVGSDSVATDFTQFKKSDFIPGKDVLFFRISQGGWSNGSWLNGIVVTEHRRASPTSAGGKINGLKCPERGISCPYQ